MLLLRPWNRRHARRLPCTRVLVGVNLLRRKTTTKLLPLWRELVRRKATKNLEEEPSEVGIRNYRESAVASAEEEVAVVATVLLYHLPLFFPRPLPFSDMLQISAT